MSKWTGYMTAAGVWLIVSRTSADEHPLFGLLAAITSLWFFGGALAEMVRSAWRFFMGSKESRDG